MSVFAIRRARPEDAAAVGAVFDAAVAESWTYLGGLEVRLSVDLEPETP